MKNLSMVKTLLTSVSLQLTDEDGNEIANSDSANEVELDVLEPREIT